MISMENKFANLGHSIRMLFSEIIQKVFHRRDPFMRTPKLQTSSQVIHAEMILA